MARRPWWITLAVKLVLSRLPLTYGFWAKIGFFRHGGMDDPAYAIAVFDTHVAAAGLTGGLAGLRVLELGPGDSTATAVIAAAAGASAVLIDAGDFASRDLQPYLALDRTLDGQVGLATCTSFDDMLIRCQGSQYLTNGLKSLQSLPSGSIDFLFSNAVLEHVNRHELDPLIKEMRRVLKPGGVMSHEVDLRDHLGGGKNNMRFSHRLWESSFFKAAGFYTNRLTCSEIKAAFLRHGFSISAEEITEHGIKPARSVLAAEFAHISDADLHSAILKLVLRT